METFQEEEYSKSAYQKNLEDQEMGVSIPLERVQLQLRLLWRSKLIHSSPQVTTEQDEDDVGMNGIKTWSDFNRVYFHPKSMLTTSGYQLDSDFMPFDVFSYGRSAFTETEKVAE
jgi:anthranilate/para-aminobenzoate synthase component II